MPRDPYCCGVWLPRLRPGRSRTADVLLAITLVAALAFGAFIVFGDKAHATSTLKIFISPNASVEQIIAIHNPLLAMSGLSSCMYWSKADYREATLVGDSVGPQSLQLESTLRFFRCQSSSSADLAAAVRRFRGQPGVYAVVGSP